MKKLLALILAVIMVLSIMPMAYAGRVTYAPEIEEYIDNYIRVSAFLNFSIYEPSEKHEEIADMLFEVLDNLDFIDFSYDTLINIEADGRLDEIIALNESLNKALDEVDKKIADYKLVCVIDSREYYELMASLICRYSLKEKNDMMDRVEKFNSEKYVNALNEVEAAKDLLFTVRTQDDFDDAMAKMRPLYDLMCACLDGNHPYGEYISDNNATEEADGTKTATCEFCGATDTITDEGTKLEKEEEPEETVSFFEMIFALIKEFFEKIFSIFK